MCVQWYHGQVYQGVLIVGVLIGCVHCKNWTMDKCPDSQGRPFCREQP